MQANIIDIPPLHVNGLVTRVNVRHHATVKKGELLFPLDDGDSSAKTPTQISRTSNSNG